MRILTPTLAIAAAAAGIAAALAVPASASQTSATGARDCTSPEAIAKLNGYQATVDKTAASDTSEGFTKLKPGETLLMAISGVLSEEVSGGKARVVLAHESEKEPLSEDGDLTQIFTDADAKPIQFPAAAGAFTWYLPATVAPEAAPGRYVQGLVAQNEAGKEIMCFQMGFVVEKSEAAAPATPATPATPAEPSGPAA